MKRLGILFLVLFIVSCSDEYETILDSDYSPIPEEISLNPNKNVFFGDTHVHTGYSFDAFLLGTNLDPQASYEYAQGNKVYNAIGEELQIARPLDFLAVTDHAIFLGVMKEWAADNPKFNAEQFLKYKGINSNKDFYTTIKAAERIKLFRESFREDVTRRGSFFDIVKAYIFDYVPFASSGYDHETHLESWEETVMAANRNYKPGQFTTFIGYEWTTGTQEPETASYHRNVIFNSYLAPVRPFSRFDSSYPEDLWDWMDNLRNNGVDSIAILHNSNGSNGNAFPNTYSDGRPIDQDYSSQRMRNEPIIEIAQQKGQSETHPKLSPNDPWASYAILNTRKGNIQLYSSPSGSYAREALQKGLALKKENRGNPYKFGFIGSSDVHNAAPSFEEKNNTGATPLQNNNIAYRSSIPIDTDVAKRLDQDTVFLEDERYFLSKRNALMSSSALAAVWAEANTREHIFDGMKKRETYATSGPRIKLRFFAGKNFLNPDEEDEISYLYKNAVPMGSSLNLVDGKPTFYVWALQDEMSQPLQRIQVVKGWYDDSYKKEIVEKVFDIACSDGLSPDEETGLCPDNGAVVNIEDCTTSEDLGASELKVIWQDDDFEANVDTFYYVRVLENPSCRWSTWDAIKNGSAPRPDIPTVIQERAWSSPIWVEQS